MIKQIQSDNKFLYILTSDDKLYRKDVTTSSSWEEFELPNVQNTRTIEESKPNRQK